MKSKEDLVLFDQMIQDQDVLESHNSSKVPEKKDSFITPRRLLKSLLVFSGITSLAAARGEQPVTASEIQNALRTSSTNPIISEQIHHDSEVIKRENGEIILTVGKSLDQTGANEVIEGEEEIDMYIQIRSDIDVNFRSGPGTDSEIVGKLPNQTKGHAFGIFNTDEDTWFHIEADGVTGWVFGAFVEPDLDPIQGEEIAGVNTSQISSTRTPNGSELMQPTEVGQTVPADAPPTFEADPPTPESITGEGQSTITPNASETEPAPEGVVQILTPENEARVNEALLHSERMGILELNTEAFRPYLGNYSLSPGYLSEIDPAGNQITVRVNYNNTIIEVILPVSPYFFKGFSGISSLEDFANDPVTKVLYRRIRVAIVTREKPGDTSDVINNTFCPAFDNNNTVMCDAIRDTLIPESLLPTKTALESLLGSSVAGTDGIPTVDLTGIVTVYSIEDM